MRKLAEFEGYLDDFVITREDLLARGLGDRPDFRAYVVPSTDRATLDGMAVTYVVPWTYARAPNLVLKELYVREGARGSGVGRQLMTAVQREAKTLGAFRIVFSVLASNERAKKFYASLGAVYDDHWRNWYLPA
ncbi:MAG: GNAT family N-acetyltransferase [Myxococcota bacterium]